MSFDLSKQILNELELLGVMECCVCSGARNAPFVVLLSNHPRIKSYWWFEERSAAFFAIGRARAAEAPVAVITTSGTAAGELFPAVMEGYYSGVPLVLITADRPRRLRGTGAPQTAEQEGMFGVYTPCCKDIADGEPFSLTDWNGAAPLHLNVCMEEVR